MSESAGPIQSEEWAVIVGNVPLVSVDLIVRVGDGFVLGLRENEPAKGEWFVPGGVVLKHERLAEAVQRVARTELGSEVEIHRYLGAYEHFYDTAAVDGVDSKHYVANAFVVEPVDDIRPADSQHSDLRIVRPPFDRYHRYVRRYLKRARRPH